MEDLSSIRKALQPFGLDSNDDEFWEMLKPIIDLKISNFRRYDNEYFPQGGARSDDVIDQLDRLHKASIEFRKALSGLNEVALYWLIGHDPSSLILKMSPKHMSVRFIDHRFDEMVERFFSPEIEAHNVNRDLEIEKVKIEHQKISRKIPELKIKFDNLLNEYHEEKDKIKKIQLGKKIYRVACMGLIEKEKMETLYILSDPFDFAQNAANRFEDVEQLARLALSRFRDAWPENDRNSNKMKGPPPKSVLMQICVNLIANTFHKNGINKIKATQTGDFIRLLKIFYFVSTGKEFGDVTETIKNIKMVREKALKMIGAKHRQDFFDTLLAGGDLKHG